MGGCLATYALSALLALAWDRFYERFDSMHNTAFLLMMTCCLTVSHLFHLPACASNWFLGLRVIKVCLCARPLFWSLLLSYDERGWKRCWTLLVYLSIASLIFCLPEIPRTTIACCFKWQRTLVELFGYVFWFVDSYELRWIFGLQYINVKPDFQNKRNKNRKQTTCQC